MNKESLVAKAKTGFTTLKVNQDTKANALVNIEEWLSSSEYELFWPQIEHLILSEDWDYLLDSFYQVIPFGTGGRRGEVGVGPNRINQITIKNSAQGHSQYLLKQYGDKAKKRGVVLAYDVRKFLGSSHFDSNLENPVLNLSSLDLAKAAAEVYAGNDIKVFLFDDTRTTPELSFAIRHLGAVGGDVFSASHNPPTHNGKKVYDEYGGQLIPPFDENLVDEVTKNVREILEIDFESAKSSGAIQIIGTNIDQAYLEAAASVSLSSARDINIAYSPFHGTGITSVGKVLQNLGFNVQIDSKTSNQSGAFENITFNIPNPEVLQSFDTGLQFAKSIDADILLGTDPDADRIGLMAKHGGSWHFLNGNEIAAILAFYAASHYTGKSKGIIIKTIVTTDALKAICEKLSLELIDGLLIGFKYIGEEMNKLEEAGKINQLIMGAEESHGYIAGNYVRDKDAVTAAIWLAELAAELKTKDETLVDYLNHVYEEIGYYKNYLTEIRMLGATGQEKIKAIQASLREKQPSKFGEFKVVGSYDHRSGAPFLSETDKAARDVLVYHLEGNSADIESIKVTIRPSGTEPKSKIYFEIGYKPANSQAELMTQMENSDTLIQKIERAVLLEMYRRIGIEFPERGFKLFWQLPLDDKIRYFEIENEIAELKSIANAKERTSKLNILLNFLGSNPTQKVNEAFKDKYSKNIEEYLNV